MFKLGVMSTIIVLILFLTAKGVFIGLILLMINFGFIVAKLAALKHHSGHEEWGHQSWGPPQKDIHVHIHNPAPTKQIHHELPYGSYAHSSSGIEAGPWSTSGYSNRRQQPAYTVDYAESRGSTGSDTPYLPHRQRRIIPGVNYKNTS